MIIIFGHVTWHAGMKLVPCAVEAQSPNHWTAREVPQKPFLKKKLLNYLMCNARHCGESQEWLHKVAN